MRAFLTGGSGFIGSHLIDALLEDGWRVAALSHRTPIQQSGRVEEIASDITDLRALESGMKDAAKSAALMPRESLSREAYTSVTIT